MDIRFPTAEEEGRQKAFTVHKNYLSSINLYILETYGPHPYVLNNLIARQRSLTGYAKLQARNLDGQDAIAQYMKMCWTSELQLRLSEVQDEGWIRYSNAWAPVHAYFAVYMAIQTWFAANMMSQLAGDHTSSLKTISNQISNRELFPRPWSVSCSGCVPLEDARYARVPLDENPGEEVEVLSSPSLGMFWPRYCTMLRTTRERRLERNFRAWKKSRGRRRMNRSEKLAVAKNLPPTTLFDFYWRLRIRASYREVDSFLTWNVSDPEHVEFRSALIAVTAATCALLESLIVATGARNLYKETSEQFLGSVDGTMVNAVTFLVERQAAVLA